MKPEYLVEKLTSALCFSAGIEMATAALNGGVARIGLSAAELTMLEIIEKARAELAEHTAKASGTADVFRLMKSIVKNSKMENLKGTIRTGDGYTYACDGVMAARTPHDIDLPEATGKKLDLERFFRLSGERFPLRLPSVGDLKSHIASETALLSSQYGISKSKTVPTYDFDLAGDKHDFPLVDARLLLAIVQAASDVRCTCEKGNDRGVLHFAADSFEAILLPMMHKNIAKTA